MQYPDYDIAYTENAIIIIIIMINENCSDPTVFVSMSATDLLYFPSSSEQTHLLPQQD